MRAKLKGRWKGRRRKIKKNKKRNRVGTIKRIGKKGRTEK